MSLATLTPHTDHQLGRVHKTPQHSSPDVRAHHPSVPTVASEAQQEATGNTQTAVSIMKLFGIIAFGLLVSQPCSSRSVSEDESVVSVYTKQPSTSGNTKTSGLYLIASNIAERITSPITRFFAFGKNQNGSETTTKRSFHRIEILEDMPEQVTKADMNPLSNEIPNERDVEELSSDGNIRKSDKKPEKITLFSSYLPTKENIELNDTINEIGSGDEEPFGFDDDEDDVDSKPREGGIIYVLEIIGSIIQLLWGGFLALFQPSKPN